MSEMVSQRLYLSESMLQQIIQDHLNDDGANLTAINAEPMENNGNGGNDFFKTEVAWKSKGKESSSNWVIKQWHRGSPTAEAMNISLPLEVMAWDHDLVRKDGLPEGIEAPYVGVATNEDKSMAWMVMEDISKELNAFNFPESTEKWLADAKYIFDRIACFHVHWEHPKRINELKKHTWLATQEAQLQMFASYYQQQLGQIPRIANEFPDEVYNRFRAATLAFIDWLPESDRGLWEEHICNRVSIIKAVSGLPQTLVHGDLDRRNIGLRLQGEKTTLLLIDWEFIGLAWPGLDIIRLVNAVENVGASPKDSQSLSDHYFESYLTHGGTRMDIDTWNRARDLAFVYECLRLCPFMIGMSLINPSQGGKNLTVTNLKRRVERATGEIRKWLC